jgi:hypothetical protein
MIPDLSPPFEFQPSRAITDRIRELLTAAQRQGLLAEAADAIAEIGRRLVNEPRKWGDPVRQHVKAKLTEYRGLHWNLVCVYGVHDRVPIVFLTSIEPLEESPLFGT